MRPNDKRKKAKRNIKIIGGVMVAIALLWLIRLTVWGDFIGLFNVNNPAYVDNDADKVTTAQQHVLLMQDEILHGHLNALQKLDKEYTTLLSDTANKNGMEGINARISAEESFLNESIDSISKELVNNPGVVDESLFTNMVTSFRLALENRRGLSNLRDALGVGKATINPGQQLMLKVKSELLAKETKIANLENALKVMQANLDKKPVAPVSVIAKVPVVVPKAPLPLSTENDNLNKEKLIEKDNKIVALTTTNSMLQKEYDRLSKQYTDAKKNLETNDLKSKSVALESKVDELNTELRLAQVDCNLARADASQIISNSKQRRVLLSEASAILNNISKSDNAAVQKKVQDKIARLNQVAKTYGSN